MQKYEPFLGSTTDREEAFPGIKSLTIKIAQSSLGFGALVRDSVYSKTTVPRNERCRNPRCKQGGLDLQTIILFHTDGDYTFYCDGHEGSPQGRRKGVPCDNIFSVSLVVEK